MDFFLYSLCHVCKKQTLDLKKCSQCKIMHYCSREHQLKDWPYHKELCKVITQIDRFMVLPADAGPTEYNRYRHSKAVLWEYGVGRSLESFENEMWMYPKVCAVCYISDVKIICELCWCVAYCSEEHQSVDKVLHGKFCLDLKKCVEIQLALFRTPTTVDWFVFDFKKELQTFPLNAAEVIKAMKFSNKIDYSQRPAELILLTEIYGPSMNIIAALEQSKFIERRRAKKTKMVVHIVAPIIYDSAKWVYLIEFLSHWVFNLKKVKIFIVGTDIPQNEDFAFGLKCAECTRKRFIGSTTALRGEYHRYLRVIPRPDLVALFDNNLLPMTCIEAAGPAAKLILFKDVPIVICSYFLDQVKRDTAQFNRSQIEFLSEPQLNPYGSSRPQRNYERENAVVYQNKYYSVFMMKRED